MNDNDQVPPRKRLSDEEAARVLSRAAELDACLSSGFTVEEIRAIAAEAGISKAAITAALSELGSGRSDTGPSRAFGGLWRARAVIHGIPLGFGIGAFFSLFRLYVHLGEHVLFAAFGLGLLPSLTIASTIRGSKRHLRFQLTNLAVWSSAMFVWSLVGGPSAEIEDLFIVSGSLALCSSLVGSTIILLRDIKSRLHGIGRRVAALFRRLVDDQPRSLKGPGKFMLMSRVFRLRVTGGTTSV